MRALPVLVLAVLLGPATAGCLGGDEDGPRLATPTDQAVVPPGTVVVDPRTDPDLADRGYVMTAAWHVGDAWDYESNHSRTLRIRVLDAREEAGRTVFHVLHVRGEADGTERRHEEWIDAANWTKRQATFPAGTITYEPPAPDLRFFRNGTFRYSELRDGEVVNRVSANSWYGGTERVRLPWISLDAGLVEHRYLVEPTGGDPIRFLYVRHVAHEYANDVVRIEPGGEAFRLVGVRYGDIERGSVASVER